MAGVDLDNQELGPTELIILSGWFSTGFTAGLTRLDLSGNPLSGACWDEHLNGRWEGGWKNGDSDLDGIIALCTSLPSSQIKQLLLLKCCLGPKSIAIVASSLPTAGLEEVDLSNNCFNPSLLDDVKHTANITMKECREVLE